VYLALIWFPPLLVELQERLLKPKWCAYPTSLLRYAGAINVGETHSAVLVAGTLAGLVPILPILPTYRCIYYAFPIRTPRTSRFVTPRTARFPNDPPRRHSCNVNCFVPAASDLWDTSNNVPSRTGRRSFDYAHECKKPPSGLTAYPRGNCRVCHAEVLTVVLMLALHLKSLDGSRSTKHVGPSTGALVGQ
jgi:hypothetical protein